MSKKIRFEAPKEYSFPEGIKEGDEFKELVTIRYEGGRKCCLYEMNDVAMPGIGKDEDDYPDKGGDGKQNYDMEYRSEVQKRAEEQMGA